MSTIPASAIVNVVPNVLAAGGAALDLSGLALTTSTQPPIGAVVSLSSPDAVSAYFGASSDEAAKGAIYFQGFDNSDVKPGNMLFAQYPLAAVPAYLRGGNVSSLTLAQLQALSGLLAVAVDGVLKSATISLAAATSFSNAAEIIGNSLSIHGVQAAQVTGSIGGSTLTVTAVISGALAVGDVVSGSGITAGTYITALVTGTGGTGTYTVSSPQTVPSSTITAYAPGVTYDSVSGAFTIYSGTAGPASTLAYGSGALATSLDLTLITGAVLSQGAAAATPAAFMTAIALANQDWATFALLFDPDAGAGNTQKLAFAAWTSTRNNRYAFICWDTDASPTTTVPATTSLGALLAASDYSGTCLIGEDPALADVSDLASVAVFVCGAVASIDFTATNGRTTMAFRSQAGLVAGVTDQTIADNLIANGYNFYGAYATANAQFVFFYPGRVSGPFEWLDSYINQIWLNNAFQLALMTLLTQAKSIPYNAAGRALIEAGLSDPINAGLNFGAFRGGVTLSASQITSVNQQAGVAIASTLQTQGWFLQVGDASAAVRQARASPPCRFWYVDGQSVQNITLDSIALQ